MPTIVIMFTFNYQILQKLFARNVVDKSIAGDPVIQPTGWEMLRYWQAYMSVKDAQIPYGDERLLAVMQDVVQIRLSALIITIGSCLLAVISAVAARNRRPVQNAPDIYLPSSQMDWIAEVAREHARNHPNAKAEERSYSSPKKYASHNRNNFLLVSSHHGTSVIMSTEFSGHAMPLSTLHADALEGLEYDHWDSYTENS